MIPFPFDSSQGDFKEIIVEYAKEELYEMYVSDNNIPEVVQEYIFELEAIIKKLRNNLK